jgi:hypothetical protein
MLMVVVVFVLLFEAVLGGWWWWSGVPSAAPVFSMPDAEEHFGKDPALGKAQAKYGADRAAQMAYSSADGTMVTVQYFEMDRVESGPAMGFAAHPAEECNVGLGYRFLGVDPNRVYQGERGTPLRFDCTRFADGSGKPVFMFKIAWIQGVGAWQVRNEGTDRIERLRRSFVRHTGAARVLLAGVFNAPDADHAWRTFRAQVLDRLDWE